MRWLTPKPMPGCAVHGGVGHAPAAGRELRGTRGGASPATAPAGASTPRPAVPTATVSSLAAGVRTPSTRMAATPLSPPPTPTAPGSRRRDGRGAEGHRVLGVGVHHGRSAELLGDHLRDQRDAGRPAHEQHRAEVRGGQPGRLHGPGQGPDRRLDGGAHHVLEGRAGQLDLEMPSGRNTGMTTSASSESASWPARSPAATGPSPRRSASRSCRACSGRRRRRSSRGPGSPCRSRRRRVARCPPAFPGSPAPACCARWWRRTCHHPGRTPPRSRRRPAGGTSRSRRRRPRAPAPSAATRPRRPAAPRRTARGGTVPSWPDG